MLLLFVCVFPLIFWSLWSCLSLIFFSCTFGPSSSHISFLWIVYYYLFCFFFHLDSFHFVGIPCVGSRSAREKPKPTFFFEFIWTSRIEYIFENFQNLIELKIGTHGTRCGMHIFITAQKQNDDKQTNNQTFFLFAVDELRTNSPSLNWDNSDI